MNTQQFIGFTCISATCTAWFCIVYQRTWYYIMRTLFTSLNHPTHFDTEAVSTVGKLRFEARHQRSLTSISRKWGCRQWAQKVASKCRAMRCLLLLVWVCLVLCLCPTLLMTIGPISLHWRTAGDMLHVLFLLTRNFVQISLPICNAKWQIAALYLKDKRLRPNSAIWPKLYKN